MQKLGNVEDKEMFRTFNMGIGMIVIISPGNRETILAKIVNLHEIGTVVKGNDGVSVR